MDYYIGIDVGGTTINVGAVSEAGDVLEEHMLNTVASKGPNQALDKIAETIKIINESLEKNHQNKTLVVGLPGVFDQKTGRIIHASNLPGWENFEFVRLLSELLGLPVVVKNDADMAALGESWAGAGREKSHNFMITLGTGIGGALVVNDHLFELNGFSGEFGHMIVDIDGNLCTCGRKGCVETFLSRQGLLQRAKAYLRQEKPTLLHSYPEEQLTPLLIATLARENDSIAKAIVSDAIKGLAIGMANLSNTIGVTNFIIGGGIANAWEILENQIRQNLQELIFEYDNRNIKVLRASLGEKAGIMGAAKLAMDLG